MIGSMGYLEKLKEQVGKQRAYVNKGPVCQGLGTVKAESMKDAAAESGAGNSWTPFLSELAS